MLAKARKRLKSDKVKAEVVLLEMDAHNLEFEDAIFTHSIIAHAITVVGDPNRVIQEMIRVTKPGGTLVVVNHHKSKLGIFGRAWEPVRYKIGLGRHVELYQILKKNGLEIISDDRVNRIHTRLITTRIPDST
jgi:ubiquinone/menaquinone biosynthesis C-methylase UbiE